jgi:oxygen-independent coproporphyrinogen-3 oxidase
MYIIDLLPAYDAPVPRYTSYPTAPHFSPDVNAATYAGWLREIGPQPLSIYLHVPFCAQLCWFCGCHTTATTGTAPVEAYAETLLAEIDLLAEAIGRSLPVAHVHWGGGTPTAMPGPRMRAVMDRLRARFHLQDDAEIAVEIDPRTATPAALDTLAGIGCTRASLGVQDFDPRVQRAVNRIQSFEATRACADGLRARGIRALNLDLIYGLPYQTEASVRETAAQAMLLQPDRIAVFGYAHVPWMKKHQALLPQEALPGTVERWRQRAATEAAILAHGWEAIGLDHYARPQDELAIAARARCVRRNFQGYTTDTATTLLGLGASAIGSLPQGYVQNAAAIPDHRDRVRAGVLPIARGIALTDDDRMRRDVIEQLMCHGTVDLDETAARHHQDPHLLLAAGPALDSMAQDGLILWDGRSVQVPDHARPLLRNVAAAFDAYLRPTARRHAQAI